MSAPESDLGSHSSSATHMWTLASYLTPLALSFHICKMHIMLPPPYCFRRWSEKIWMTVYKTKTLTHCWWEYKLVNNFGEKSGHYLLKVKIWVTFSPTILLYGISLQTYNTCRKQDTCIKLFISALLKTEKKLATIQTSITTE